MNDDAIKPSASELARRAELETLAAEAAVLREKHRKAEAVKAPIAELTEKRARIQELLAQHVAAGLDGSAPPATSETDLHEQLGDVNLELEALQVQAQGAELAQSRIRAQIGDVNTRRAATLARHERERRLEVDDRLAALASSGQLTVAPAFEGFYVELGAWSAVRDRLKLASEPYCADVFGRTKLALPAPFGIKAFDDYAAPRDLRPQIEARAQAILRELGIGA